MNKKVLASRLNNRVEIFREVIERSELGDKRVHQPYKKVWAVILKMENSNQ